MKKLEKPRMTRSLFVVKNYSFLALLMLAVLTGCTNLMDQQPSLNTLNPNPSSTPSNLNLEGSYTHELKNATVSPEPTQANSSNPATSLFSLAVDSSGAQFKPLLNYCDLTARPCECDLMWTETNTVGSMDTSVQRRKRLPVVEVQPGLVKCRMDNSFYDEIASGTIITLDIVPSILKGNTTGLSVKPINFKKGTSIGTNGDFFDDTLTPFKNILRYTCYSKRNSSHQILNAITQKQEAPSSGADPVTYQYPLASMFCTGSGSGTDGKNCGNVRSGYSAQSYYRNFYVNSDKVGDINSNNDGYECPQVLQGIKNKMNSAGGSPDVSGGKAWPLDSTFALATTKSADWSVGVDAVSVLAKQGDSNANISVLCAGTTKTSRFNDVGVVTKCMGYAKKPKADGTCGSMQDSHGNTRPLVRLRRFRTVYPPYFDAQGKVDKNRPIETDEVYVADRLVVDAQGVPTGDQIFGPKPCNFAWFDHEGVVNRGLTNDFQSSINNGLPQYVATNKYKNSTIGSVNPDGLIFPNQDKFVNINNNSCSASLPVVAWNMGIPSVQLRTTYVNQVNSVTVGTKTISLSEVHVRPIDPWAPSYFEDTSFQACVPASDPYLEPPLHFMGKKIGTKNYVGWCAEVYPTHNPYWVEMNKKRTPQTSTALAAVVVDFGNGTPARVKNYTSHDSSTDVVGSVASCNGYQNICVDTLGATSTDLASCKTLLGESAGNNFCHRTVKYDPVKDFRGFPLLAKSDDIKDMLDSDADHDKAFGCTYSVNSNASKIGKEVPSSGCCGVVSGTAVLNQNASFLNSIGVSAIGAHMEPYKGSNDNIRYCGNPVK